MTAIQTELELEIVELATEAFESFCEDISGMFGIDIECTQQQFSNKNAKELKKIFKKLSAVNTVKAEGVLNGNFHFVFDKEGLFTLAGVIVMLPEQRILDMIKQGSEPEAKDMSDAIGEMGNLLVGSWDRIFRENREEHKHFSQINTFIGNPWTKPEESIGINRSEELLFVPYELTVGSYKTFNCGVAFPKSILKQSSDHQSQETAETPQPQDIQHSPEQADTQTPQDTQQTDTEVPKPTEPADKQQTAEEDTAQTNKDKEIENQEQQPVAKEQAVDKEKNEEVSEEQTEPSEQDKTDPRQTAQAKEQAASEDTETKNSTVETTESQQQSQQKTVEQNVGEADTPTTEDTTGQKPSEQAEPQELKVPDESQEIKAPAEAGVSETIQKMAQSSADLPGQHNPVFLALSAKDIMQTQLVWATPDDSVQQTLASMHKADTGYILIGSDQIPEGIISKSDLNSAVSTYLKPAFAKWRRPLDDATLQIKIKWIMTRPVKTIKPDTTLAVIMDTMRQFGNRCLPVTDETGKALGLVTVFDIFKALTNNPNFATAGNTPQSPPLA